MSRRRTAAWAAGAMAAAVLAAAAAGQGCTGEVGHWRLDGDATDSSGAGNHGTAFGDPAYAPGVLGSAMVLDGVNDYVRIANAPSLNPAGAISLCAWYRPVSFSGLGNDPIIDKPYSSHNFPYYQYGLYVTGDQYGSAPASFAFLCAANGSIPGAGSGQGAWVPGRWYGLVGTYDGATISFYLDGVLRSSYPASGSVADYGSAVILGAFGNLNYYLPGAIDEVRIFERALSADEATLVSLDPRALAMAAPASSRVCPGTTATLRAVTLAAAGATFQWRHEGRVIDAGNNPSAVTDTLVVPNMSNAENGVYDCIVTTPCGGTGVSLPAMLGLLPWFRVECGGPGCDPDITCDGNADQDDVACLIDAVAGNPGCECQDADFNGDGNADQDDVAALINVVAGGDCP